MPKVTEAHLEARKQQILDGAAACFARRGFHQSTMQDICAETQLSPGAVYRYFGSKEEIIEAICEDGRRRGLAMIDAVRDRGDTMAVLDELAEFFFGTLEEDPQVCPLDVELWAEAMRNPRVSGVVRRMIDSLRGALAGLVRTGQARGEINRRLDADSVARVMMSFFEGLVVQKGIDAGVDVRGYVAAMRAMLAGDFWQGRKLEGSDGDVRVPA